MKFSIALLAAIASHAVTAFKVPEGTADGVYTAHYDANGNEVLERIGDIAEGANPIGARSLLPPSGLEKRNRAWCGCGIRMTGGDCDNATHGVENILGGGHVVYPIGSIFAKSGSVVAFLCNHSRAELYANAGDARGAWSQTTDHCGFYIAGTWQIDGDLTGGYMTSDQDFCAHDRDAGAGSC